MPVYATPGVYVEEVATGARPIEAVGTSTAAFLGVAPDPSARVHEPVAISNPAQFVREFVPPGAASTALSHAVFGFFDNLGTRCYVVNLGPEGNLLGSGRGRQGIAALEALDEVAIVAAPGMTDAASYDAVLSHCEKMRDRVAILDAPLEVGSLEQLTRAATVAAPGRRGRSEGEADEGPATPGLACRRSDAGLGALYFPWITVRDRLAPPGTQDPWVNVAPSGHMAGIWARTDARRGVHKAPANELVAGAFNLSYRVTASEQGELNRNGVNVIRLFDGGIRVWGARTVAPPDSEWKYVPVRRLFCMIEESIAKSTQWVVFEPNAEPLWKAIRRDVSAFLRRLWAQGALMGKTPEEAFFVKCDEETNPPESIDAGLVVTEVGIAPVKPAEFIVFRIGQHAAGPEIEV